MQVQLQILSPTGPVKKKILDTVTSTGITFVFLPAAVFQVYLHCRKMTFFQGQCEDDCYYPGSYGSLYGYRGYDIGSPCGYRGFGGLQSSRGLYGFGDRYGFGGLYSHRGFYGSGDCYGSGGLYGHRGFYGSGDCYGSGGLYGGSRGFYGYGDSCGYGGLYSGRYGYPFSSRYGQRYSYGSCYPC
nr:PREDICTED: keratin-associated protein 19-2-like [Apteryx mantelli mantelli]